MLTCPACSTPNPDAAVYCARCGATLPRPGAGSTVPGSPYPVASTAPASPLDAQAPAQPQGPRYLVAGDVVDKKYRIESVLGEGGMGIVYLATDLNTDTKVVVKAIRSEMAHEPDLRERVRAEGRALAQIDHPNVVRLNAVVVEQSDLYLVMQFVDGKSLDKIIEQRVLNNDPMPFPQALSIFRQVVAGVGAAHAEGVVHRDIKPGNVLIRGRDGVAKVTDFGIAKQEADAKAGKGKTRGIIGSLWYMAPEQVTGRRDLDKRVDVYALGIMFFEMLVGRVPFDASGDYEIMRMHVETPLPSVVAVRGDLPSWVDALLARACAKDRDARFSSCEELLAALEQFSPERPPTTSLPAVPPSQLPTSHPSHHGPTSQPSTTAPNETPPSHRATTGDAAATSSTNPGEPTPRPRWPLAAGAFAFALLGVGVWLFGFSGLLDEPSRPPHRPVASASARPRASASASAQPQSRLGALQGRWVSESGRRYQAVQIADILEFRIVDPRQFEGQDYQLDEPRFVLSEVASQPWFGVEDKIRPRGPSGTTFDPRSRGTCQSVWKQIKNEPLKAYFDGAKLRVDMVNLTPNPDNFEQTRDRKLVLGCTNLGSSRADKIETTLTREP